MTDPFDRPSDSVLDALPTVEDVVKTWLESPDQPDVAIDLRGLVNALQDREETIKGLLQAAGAQFGLFPAIVAEVLADVKLGHPISTEERALIHSNFHVQMEQLRRFMQGDQ